MEHQGQPILMFLDNCSSHSHVHLSNIKLVFYLKNTMSRLQAMDQGVIVNLKKNYAKHMLNVACMEIRRAKNVTEIIREIKIFDAILQAKVVWEQVDPHCIIKCFKWSRVLEQENPPSPPLSPVYAIEEEDDFANYFQELLDIPWYEYLAMDEDLECEEPARAPNTQAYCIDDRDINQDHDKDYQSEPEPIQPEIAIEHLINIQKSNLDDIKLFDLLEQAMPQIQSKKTTTELTNKSHHCINSSLSLCLSISYQMC